MSPEVIPGGKPNPADPLYGVLDSLAEGCQLIGPDWRYIYLNKAAAAQGRRPREELIGRTMMQEYPGIEDTRMFLLLRICMEERVIQQLENEFTFPDGSTGWFELRMEPVPQGVFIISQEITQRKRAELEMRRLTTAIHQSAEAVLIADAEGTILYVNPAFQKVTGYGPEEVIGRTPRILKSGRQDPAFYTEMWSTISNGRTWRGRLVNRRKDGSHFTEDATISPVADGNGRIVNYVCVKRDVTHELQLERQFHQAQKMEALGQLAGGVAHDFNNILSLVIGYSDVLLQSLGENAAQRADVVEIRKAAERATSLTRQLLAISRNQPLQAEVMEPNAVISGMDNMLRRVLGENIDLQTRLQPDLGRARLEAGQLEQIIMNLAINARDAMPHGGRLMVESANVELDDEYASHRFRVTPGSYVMIAVSDTGHGMSEEVQMRAFEPFFTTKEAGHGTGLGLATVYGIVKQAGGSIWIYSEEGSGTTFKIYLPRVSDPVPAGERVTPAAPAPVTGETILLVEDEPDVRRITTRLLVSHGYQVLAAASGEEALELCEKHGASLKMMLTDVMMPGMSGVELATRAVRVCPGLRILYMSGYAENAVNSVQELGATVRFLSKPFSSTDLARKIREVLDA